MADPAIRRCSWIMRRESATWNAEPNAAHRAVAELDRRPGVAVRVITQNVDGLHQLGGTPDRKVLELHGTARTVTCTAATSARRWPRRRHAWLPGRTTRRARCGGGILKSATVVFGERLDPVVLGKAMAVAKACEVFVAVGTTLQVQPAASLAGVAAEHGARLIVVNAEPTPYDEPADEIVREPIGTALPALLERLAGWKPA